jgi:superfamily I DNA/RNA helicase
VVLRTNYRNTRPILDAAQALVAHRDFTDLDTTAEPGRQAVDVLRDGPPVEHDTAPNRKGLAYILRQAMRRHARAGIDWGEMAVLCHTHQHLDDLAERLTRLDVPLTPLEHWDGRPDPNVKIGTIHRSKGLDFAAVYLPDLDMPPFAAAEERESMQDTAWERDRTQREYVARTRPRDRLWIGRLRRPTPRHASGSA